PAGTRIRATSTLRRAEVKGNMIETMNEVVVEAEGSDKPVCVAESVGRMVF
ncbi:MAG: dehydratase, partial [Gammaproteobacteria bacterium]|nr:dehydratase [Gammaproteobacteria bacterium]